MNEIQKRFDMKFGNDYDMDGPTWFGVVERQHMLGLNHLINGDRAR